MDGERTRSKESHKNEWLIKEYEVYTSFECSCRAQRKNKLNLVDYVMMILWCETTNKLCARVFERKKTRMEKIPLISFVLFFVARVP